MRVSAGPDARFARAREVASIWLALATVPILAACGNDPAELTASVPLHLEDHLDEADIVGSPIPDDVPDPVNWSFDRPQPDWQPLDPLPDGVAPAELEQTADGLRISLTEANDYKSADGRPNLGGGIWVPLPDWQREDWGDILVRARTEEKIEGLVLGFRLRKEIGEKPWERFPFQFAGRWVPVMRDGSTQTYVLRADWSMDYAEQWEGPWTELGISFGAEEPASIELLSITVVPKEASYTDAPFGVRTEARDQVHRRALFTHTPARLEYRVRVPESGRLDFGLGVLRSEVPVTFRVSAETDGGAETVLFDEAYSDRERWGLRSVDLARLAGERVTLSLETDADREGSVALWASPTLSGARLSQRPNIIFYIIDGAGADYMSTYGYNRRTTPNLERLAAQGALFEQAYSNASWTRPSTLSFLTSMYHGALGGMRNNRNAPPAEVAPIAEQLRGHGYQTAFFTSNPNAASMSGLERGVDILREKSVEPTSHSTRELHQDFWSWRDNYPGEPYWVHFQTTDVHWPHNPPDPFAGVYVEPERRKTLDGWKEKLEANLRPFDPWGDAFEQSGVDRLAFFDANHGLYDEGMAHQDYQLGRLVERLKATGEWEHTLLIVAADHGADAGSWDYEIFGMDPLPPQWQPILRRGTSRIPMIFVWPGHIEPGRRFREPVSMIDMVPTILDLAGLPQAEHTQGRSLAPLLLGDEGFEPRPVFFEEVYVDANTGKAQATIEIVDGRWGASLEIVEDPDEDDRRPEQIRPVPLLVYDLWNDPACINSLHEERPDLVEKYTPLLQARFREHRALSEQFSRGDDSPLSAHQLQTLQALGYIE